MKVFGTGVDTDVKRGRIAFRGGDVCDPKDGEQLNGPPWPTVVRRCYVPVALLPWICLRIGRFGFYAGWKCYGFDLQNYLNWPGITKADVYPGSMALELTARFFSDGA